MQVFAFFKRLRIIGIALFSIVLTACGGGGGGGSNSETGFQVSLDRTSLYFDAEEGSAFQPIVIVGTGTGSPPKSLFVGSVDLGTSIERVTYEISGTRVTFTVYPKSNLSAGTYSGSLQLLACVDLKCTQQFAGSPATVPYTIVVTKELEFLVDGDTSSRQLSAEISTDLLGMPKQSWTATTTANWFKILNSGGTTGVNNLQVALDSNELLKMDNFTSLKSEIEIHYGSGNVTPKKHTIKLSKRIPEVNFVSPATLLPGESGNIIVRGRGFNGVKNLEQSINVTGLAVKSVTRINDTQLILEIENAALGNAKIALNNALSVSSAPVELKILSQPSFSYRAIPTEGIKSSIYFDPERQSIYTSNKGSESVMRFAVNNNSWTVTSASLKNIDSAVMSPDRKSILTTSTDNKITLLDPVTLGVQSSYQTAGIAGYPHDARPRLTMTNNGKAYFQGANFSDGLDYFDLVTRKFGKLKWSGLFYFYDGPWFNVSGDGDHLMIVQTAGLSPRPPMLYLNSSDEVVKVNSAGIEAWYEAAQSFHGERFFANNNVWDRNFILIGNVVLPESYYGHAHVFAPDGNRLYILAYHDSAYSSSGTPTAKPRIYVVDTSQKPVATPNLSVLGYFDIDDYPSCPPASCRVPYPLSTISPDGKTLFYIGDKNLVVVPVPVF